MINTDKFEEDLTNLDYDELTELLDVLLDEMSKREMEEDEREEK